MLKSAWQWLVEALFPKRCQGCGSWGNWCCPRCLASLTYPRQLHCPTCKASTPLGEFCSECSGGNYLNGLWSAQSYSNKLIRNLIKSFKFEGLTEIAPILANLMISFLRTFNLPPAWHNVPKDQWILTFVPLTKRRLRQRNFNQSEILAELIATATTLTVKPTLHRLHGHKPQSELNNESERITNVSGAFSMIEAEEISGKCFILVDDVYTSGATMEECAHLLKQAGAQAVWGLTAAKG